MNFNSAIFLIFFLPVFLVLYYLVPVKYRFFSFLIFSVFFYYLSGLFNTILLFVVAVVNYLFALLLNKHKQKLVLIFGIVLNILCLTFFKYNKSIALPLGISFYTFNNLSYLIDVYKNKYEAEKNIFYYLTYAFMFTHVTMGPITKYNIVKEGIQNSKLDFDEIEKGLRRFLEGLFKKVLLADNLGILYHNLSNANEKSVLLQIMLIVVFGLQLFFDFSGYSDMAIGIGRMLGIKYPENFDYPYLATSVSSYWRKWHMSLTRFFTEYIYIPLGGNRVSNIRHIINIMIVWLLTGIWHGSTLNYILWGLYYGVILIVEKKMLDKHLEKWPNVFRHIYVLFIVFIGYIFFSSNDLNGLISYFKILFNTSFINSTIVFYLKENIVLLVVSIMACSRIPTCIKTKFNNKLVDVVYILVFILTLAFIISSSYSPFLYNAF